MKKIVLINSFLLLSSVFSYAQYSIASNSRILVSANTVNSFNESYTNKSTKDANYYITKSRNQKVAAYCLISAGAIGLVVGLASFPKNGDILFADDKDQVKADRATTITIVGAVLMCGSIPFFILSNSNKKKARLYINSEKVSKGIPVHTGNITGLTFDIPIGK